MQQPHKRREIVLVLQLICRAKLKDTICLELPPHTHTVPKASAFIILLTLLQCLPSGLAYIKQDYVKKTEKKVLLNLIDFVFSKRDTTGCITSSSVHMLTYNKVYIKSCSKKVRLYIGTYVQLLIKKLHKAFVWLVRWQQLVKMTC